MSPWADAANRLESRTGGPPGELWQLLMDGRLTIVDWFDDDGRRVVVARRNPRATHRLSHVERTVVTSVASGRPQKVAAFELGLSAAAISDALARALDKLGLSSAADLARVAAALRVAQ